MLIELRLDILSMQGGMQLYKPNTESMLNVYIQI